MAEQENESNNPNNEENSNDEENNRPSGTRTAEDSTGVNPEAEEPIDPEMPSMPPA